jgi:L-iditol 2-dehydrogenase
MEGGALPIGDIVDDSFSVDDPTAAFDAFLASETCKPLFTFAD